jgi:TIR domain
MPTKKRIFISYARRDGEAFATALRSRIEAEKPEITVWQDRSQMEGGVGWWKQITTALEDVEFLVLVLTAAALKSEVSQKEWRYARQVGVCVYPVKGVPDSELDFGAMPLWMRQAHFFDVDREWDTFIKGWPLAPFS